MNVLEVATPPHARAGSHAQALGHDGSDGDRPDRLVYAAGLERLTIRSRGT